MPWVFNPFTGKLDQTGSGGSATTNASLLTSGTLADARLSANVSLDNIDNEFSSGQTIKQGTLTAQKSALAATATWNNSGTTFRALTLNVTDTASAATSLLMDLQVGGTSRFGVTKAGAMSFGATTSAIIQTGGGNSWIQGGYGNNTFIYSDGLRMGVNSDIRLERDAANTLAQRNGTNAQTTRIYGTYTDASNGRRLDITSTTGGIFTLTATGNGTGASGNLLKLTQPILLPASSVTLATNGDLAFEATSNTTLTIRYRGSDGTTRSAALTLS